MLTEKHFEQAWFAGSKLVWDHGLEGHIDHVMVHAQNFLGVV